MKRGSIEKKYHLKSLMAPILKKKKIPKMFQPTNNYNKINTF